MPKADTKGLATARYLELARQLTEELGSVPLAAKRMKVDRSYFGKLQNETSRGVGHAKIAEACDALGLSPEWFWDASVPEGTSYKSFVRTTVEKEHPHAAVIDAFARERAAAGKPIDEVVLGQMKQDIRAWRGIVTRDTLVMLLPIAIERAGQ